MQRRVSRRTYTGPVPEREWKILCEMAERFEQKSGVRFSPFYGNPEAFRGFHASYGMFSGVESGFMLGGNEMPDRREKIGYFGELLVLEATRLGLGSCWVGGTYRPEALPWKEETDGTLDCVLVMGTVSDWKWKEKILYRMVHRGTKEAVRLYVADEMPPEWFLKGMEAVRLAPSAVNRQPVVFHWKNGVASAHVSDLNSLRDIDLGIAKVHFALAAGGNWQWGNGGIFHKE